MRMAHDREAGRFDARQDLPGHAFLDGIWFDDGKRSFHIRSIISAASALGEPAAVRGCYRGSSRAG